MVKWPPITAVIAVKRRKGGQAIIGLSDEALIEVRSTLDAYNRANLVNLLAMLGLLERLNSDASCADTSIGTKDGFSCTNVIRAVVSGQMSLHVVNMKLMMTFLPAIKSS